MSATITAWGASYFLDTLFGGRQAPPAAYWVALCTAAPGAQADGTMLAEPDPNAGYARTLLGSDAVSWNAADTGVITSAAAVVFPGATADWVTVTHYALCDAQINGNVFLYGSFATPRRVMNGDVARIPAGLLHLSLANLSNALVSTF
jgi:hypothetical protein